MYARSVTQWAALAAISWHPCLQVYAQDVEQGWLPIGYLYSKQGGEAVLLVITCLHAAAMQPWYSAARSSAMLAEHSSAYQRMRQQFFAFFANLPALHKQPLRAYMLKNSQLPRLVPGPQPPIVPQAVKQMLERLKIQVKRKWRDHVASLQTLQPEAASEWCADFFQCGCPLRPTPHLTHSASTCSIYTNCLSQGSRLAPCTLLIKCTP
jgi:hypothetical protein